MKQNITIGNQNIEVKFSFYALREFFKLGNLTFDSLGQIEKNPLDFIEPLIVSGLAGAQLKPANEEMKEIAALCLDEMTQDDMMNIITIFGESISGSEKKNHPKEKKAVKK